MFLKSILLNSVLILIQVQSSPVVTTTPTKSPSTSTTPSVKNPPITTTTPSKSSSNITTMPSKSSSNITTKPSKSSSNIITTPSKSAPVVIIPPITGFLCGVKEYPLAHCGIVNQQGTIRSVPADIITMRNVTHYSCDEVFQEETLGAYCCQVMLRQGAKYCRAAVIQVLT